MPWHTIGEIARCAGRHRTGKIGPNGSPRSKRCPVILVIGAQFYLHESKPYCEACAHDPEQEINARVRCVKLTA